MARNPIGPEADDYEAGPVLPRDSVAGNALVAVIAIMSFLAALTVGADWPRWRAAR